MGTDLSRALGEIAGEVSRAAGGLPVDALRGRLVRRTVARGASVALVSVAAVAGLGAVANALLTSTPPAAPPAPTATGDPAPSVVSPTPDADPSDAVADPVVLTRQGIGDLAMGAEDPLPALTDRFGEPDLVRAGDGLDCAGSAASVAVWGDLAVTIARNPGGDGPDGPERLMAWWVTGPDLPGGVTTASGVQPGQPMDDVRALAGAEEVAWDVTRQMVVRAAGVMHLPGTDDTVEAVAYGGVSCR